MRGTTALGSSSRKTCAACSPFAFAHSKHVRTVKRVQGTTSTDGVGLAVSDHAFSPLEADVASRLRHISVTSADASFTALSQLFIRAVAAGCPALETFVLWANAGPLSGASIVELAKSCCNLKELALCRANELTQSSLKDVLTHLPRLRKMALSHCRRIESLADMPEAALSFLLLHDISGTVPRSLLAKGGQIVLWDSEDACINASVGWKLVAREKVERMVPHIKGHLCVEVAYSAP
ncbi:hypothetical protein DFJ74DRAFT_515276 [Hyaloraphidium curvatum]|nr:hypothetical protein DFJ74DRAFT_515276 [Hyaloraphidium curvatum]